MQKRFKIEDEDNRFLERKIIYQLKKMHKLHTQTY